MGRNDICALFFFLIFTEIAGKKKLFCFSFMYFFLYLDKKLLLTQFLTGYRFVQILLLLNNLVLQVMLESKNFLQHIDEIHSNKPIVSQSHDILHVNVGLHVFQAYSINTGSWVSKGMHKIFHANIV